MPGGVDPLLQLGVAVVEAAAHQQEAAAVVSRGDTARGGNKVALVLGHIEAADAADEQAVVRKA